MPSVILRLRNKGFLHNWQRIVESALLLSRRSRQMKLVLVVGVKTQVATWAQPLGDRGSGLRTPQNSDGPPTFYVAF